MRSVCVCVCLHGAKTSSAFKSMCIPVMLKNDSDHSDSVLHMSGQGCPSEFGRHVGGCHRHSGQPVYSDALFPSFYSLLPVCPPIACAWNDMDLAPILVLNLRVYVGASITALPGCTSRLRLVLTSELGTRKTHVASLKPFWWKHIGGTSCSAQKSILKHFSKIPTGGPP